MGFASRCGYGVGAALLLLWSCTLPEFEFKDHATQDAGFSGSAGTGAGGQGASGAGGSGGAPAGGGSSGEAGSGATGGGGTGGGTACTSDLECEDPTPKCHPKLKKCTACATDTECPDAMTYCADNGSCLPGCKLTAETGCPAGEICAPDHKCQLPCDEDKDCPLGEICDETSKWCKDGCTASHGCNPQTFPDCCSGQCVNTSLSADNCGQCGNVCPTPANGLRVCQLKVCGVQCNVGGTANCNGDVLDGCETIVATDANHCGGCNNKCAPGQVCQAQKCVDP
jgi:hypothetical protein